jgi:hypothetical protein
MKDGSWRFSFKIRQYFQRHDLSQMFHATDIKAWGDGGYDKRAEALARARAG